MKKLSKLSLTLILITIILSPFSVFATPTTQDQVPTTEEETQTTPEGTQTTEEELTPEQQEQENELRVDENNNSPFANDKKENKDESNLEKEIIKKPVSAPASVTGETYQGSGTVVDFTTSGEKAFYTIKGSDNSVYYIVIDMDKTENNVYFLNDVNGEELSLNDVSSQTNEINAQPQEPTLNEEIAQEPKKESNAGSIVFWLILVLGGIGFLAYHLLFGKLKKFDFLKRKNKNKENNNTSDVKENEEKITQPDTHLEAQAKQVKEQSERQEQNEEKDKGYRVEDNE